MLEGGGHAKRRGQIQARRGDSIDAAEDRIAHEAETGVLAITLVPVKYASGLRREDIGRRALGVVRFNLEVVAMADHRRVQLEAAADRPAPT